MGKQATEVSYALINRTRARARFTVNAHAKWSNTICIANAAEDIFPMQIPLGHPVGCGQNAETVAHSPPLSAQNSDSKRSSDATNQGAMYK